MPPPTLDTTALYDIEGPMALTQVFPWKVTLGVIGGLILAVIIYKLYCKRKPKTKPTPSLPPYDEALRRLSHVPLGAEAASFAAAISDILRAFIQQKLDYPIICQTTEEFIHTLGASALHTPIYPDILAFLKHCDLIKFAKAPLGKEERSDLLSTAHKLLDALHHMPANRA